MQILVVGDFTQAGVQKQAMIFKYTVDTYWVDAKRIRSCVHACHIGVQRKVWIVTYIFRPKK